MSLLIRIQSRCKHEKAVVKDYGTYMQKRCPDCHKILAIHYYKHRFVAKDYTWS